MSSPLSPTGVRLLDSADIAAMTKLVVNTINVTVGTLAVNVLTGGSEVVVITTNAVPGTQTTRTAAQMFADDPTAYVGQGYMVRVCNSGAGTLTLAGGTGVTISGTATVATATFRDFSVVYSGSVGIPLVTITNIGTGTYT